MLLAALTVYHLEASVNTQRSQKLVFSSFPLYLGGVVQSLRYKALLF